jgi:hypothetical protein
MMGLMSDGEVDEMDENNTKKQRRRRRKLDESGDYKNDCNKRK